jgi:hypothetical protein
MEDKGIIEVKALNLAPVMDAAKISLQKIMHLETELQRISASKEAAIILDEKKIVRDLAKTKEEVREIFGVVIEGFSRKEILNFLREVYGGSEKEDSQGKALKAFGKINKIYKFFLADEEGDKKKIISPLRCAVFIDSIIKDMESSETLVKDENQKATC